jgi:hypothetical protein
MTVERIHFKLIVTPCCSSTLCYINPRLPNYCQECGTRIYPEVKSCITADDPNATIHYNGNRLKN